MPAANPPKRKRIRIDPDATGIKLLRQRRGLSQQEVADALNTQKSTISEYENNQHKMDWGWAQKFAKFYNVSPSLVMFAGEAPTIAVAGYVGAGAAVYPIDDHAKGAGLMRVRCPETLNPDKTVAVRVQGESMSPGIENGWILYYSRDPELDAAAFIGKLCIVRLPDEMTLVKHVRQGPQPGLFNLMSVNAPMIEGVKIEWASPVRAMLSTEQAEPDLSDDRPVDSDDESLFNQVAEQAASGLALNEMRLPEDQLERVITSVFNRMKAGEARARDAEKRPSPRRTSPKTTNHRQRGEKSV